MSSRVRLHDRSSVSPVGNTAARRSRAIRRHLTGWLFIGPAVIVYVAFVVYPLFYSILLSFYQWAGFQPRWGPFVGLQNYGLLARDPIFWKALTNNILFVVLRTPFEVGIALLLALLLNERFPGRLAFRTLIFVPVVLSLIVVGVVFGRIFEPTAGVLNTFLRLIGLGSLALPWLGDAGLALPAVTAVSIWKNVGFSMVILLAGLQSTPPDVLDAARVDGAGAVRTALNVTIPILRPVIAITVALSVISSLKVFDLVYIMTSGGPLYSTEVLTTYLYRVTFVYNQVGVGSSVAVVLMLLILGISMVQLRVMRDE
ncbi:MAG TPA: sugar ABC transporter permease [Chloroflexota bacterium]|nr:sugar ABC transporter permease [Chloroflexota bacterium]